jgi:hypothetical protein
MHHHLQVVRALRPDLRLSKFNFLMFVRLLEMEILVSKVVSIFISNSPIILMLLFWIIKGSYLLVKHVFALFLFN